MKHRSKDRKIKSPGDKCLDHDCPEIATNDSPVAHMGILMLNEEDCPGSADFWMARIKYSLHSTIL